MKKNKLLNKKQYNNGIIIKIYELIINWNEKEKSNIKNMLKKNNFLINYNIKPFNLIVNI